MDIWQFLWGSEIPTIKIPEKLTEQEVKIAEAEAETLREQLALLLKWCRAKTATIDSKTQMDAATKALEMTHLKAMETRHNSGKQLAAARAKYSQLVRGWRF